MKSKTKICSICNKELANGHGYSIILEKDKIKSIYYAYLEGNCIAILKDRLENGYYKK